MMNPLALIVSTVFLLVTIGWKLTLYYYIACFIVSNFAPYHISIIIWIGPLIYGGVPWWYDLYLAQAIFFQVQLVNAKTGFKEGTLEKYEAQDAMHFTEIICGLLALIAFIGGIYTLFK